MKVGPAQTVCTSLCLQKHHSPALPDHHPGEEVPQSPDVPRGTEEYLRRSQSQVGGAVENLLPDLQRLLLFAQKSSFAFCIKPSLLFFCSMTEMEKDIGNLRSGLKSVESVSHKER